MDEGDDRTPPCQLGAGHDRPRDRRAAEQCKELAPSHVLPLGPRLTTYHVFGRGLNCAARQIWPLTSQMGHGRTSCHALIDDRIRPNSGHCGPPRSGDPVHSAMVTPRTAFRSGFGHDDLNAWRPARRIRSRKRDYHDDEVCCPRERRGSDHGNWPRSQGRSCKRPPRPAAAIRAAGIVLSGL